MTARPYSPPAAKCSRTDAHGAHLWGLDTGTAWKCPGVLTKETA